MRVYVYLCVGLGGRLAFIVYSSVPTHTFEFQANIRPESKTISFNTIADHCYQNKYAHEPNRSRKPVDINKSWATSFRMYEDE